MLAAFARRSCTTSTSAPCCKLYAAELRACRWQGQRQLAVHKRSTSIRAAGWTQGFPLGSIIGQDWDDGHAFEDDLQHLRWQRCPVHLACEDDSNCDYDILGIGQGMVDYAASVDDDLLQRCNVPKGGRRVISVEERALVIELLSGLPSRLSAGGSLANTLVGLARLGSSQSATNSGSSRSSSHKGRSLRVAMGGAIGGDALGKYFAAQLAAAGVECVGTPPAGSQTGTVMVFATPDAQRSFLSYFSNDGLTISQELEVAVQRSRLVVIEGYLFELPGAEVALPAIVRTAKQAGAAVALTAGDTGVVARHRQAMLDTVSAGVDVLFTNAAEAAQLVHGDGNTTGSASSSSSSSVSASQEVAGALGGLCAGALAVVTDSSCGSYIVTGGKLLTVPPAWSTAPPVDTCGAGDAYAAGLLFGLLQGLSLPAMGRAAACTASAVIGRMSPHLHQADAEKVIAGLPLQLQPLTFEGLQGMLAGSSSSSSSSSAALGGRAAVRRGNDSASSSA